MIDAVVVNYKTPHDLKDFMESWMEFAPAEAALTVVNVSPEQADMDTAAKYEGPGVKVISAMDNIGYARACNMAARMTYHSEIMAFFNADVVLTEGSLQECEKALTAGADWGVLGPRQVNERGLMTHAGILGTGAEPKIRGWQRRDSEEYGDIRDDVPTVSGAAYFIKRQVWEELYRCPIYQKVAPLATGAFLPTQHYYEETWVSYHARAHGWKCVYYGPVKIIHKWHRSSPVGGIAEVVQPRSQALFRYACDQHSIPHD